VPAPTISQGKFSVGAEVGGRGYATEPGDRELGKFEEYRDLRAGPLLNQLVLKYTPADSFNVYGLTARRVGYRDQSIWLRAMKPGKADFNLRWDRIPHTYSTTARSPGVEDTPGFNTLPVPRPDSIAWRTSPFLDPVRQQWDPVKASLSVTPTEKLDLKGEYMYIRKNGGIPLSMSFNGSSGPQREFVGPIDQSVNDVRFTPGFASGERNASSAVPFVKSYQLMATYDYSHFSDAIKSVMVDNPQISVSSPTLGAASSRIATPPDNSAQTLSVTGALGLPVRTRLMGTVSSSWMTQNDQLLPQTSNDSLQRDANFGLLALPRSSLNGKVQTTLLNFSATSNPVSELRLAARVRRYKRDNNTAPFHINAMAVSDRSIVLADSATTELNPFTKDNAEFSANYLVMRALSLTGAYTWENWTRDAETRNFGKTREKGPRVALDYTGMEWLSFHASYSDTKRRGDGAYTVSGTEITDFRRFDLADRDRKKTNFLATVSPIDKIDLTLNYQVADDNFPSSQYGTQTDKSNAKGFDVDFTPVPQISLSAGYSRDDGTNILNNRFRTGAVGSVTDNNPTYKWTSTTRDHNNTTYVSVNATLIPDRLDFMGSFSNIDARWQMFNVNPTTPAGGTAAQNLSATAENWPEVKQNVKPISLSLKYLYSADWGITLRYQDERYTQTDFRTSQPLFAPFNGAPGNIPGSIGNPAGAPITNTGQYHFLSAGYLPYTASFFTLLVSYQLPEMRFSSGRSAF
jgi:MtrB/PioB family decaheme-associated outer membrane protein